MPTVIVRDGRINRDPTKVTAEGGEILTQYDVPDPSTFPDIGDRLTLPDQTEVEVIGINEIIRSNERQEITEHIITAFIGNTWELE